MPNSALDQITLNYDTAYGSGRLNRYLYKIKIVNNVMLRICLKKVYISQMKK